MFFSVCLNGIRVSEISVGLQPNCFCNPSFFTDSVALGTPSIDLGGSFSTQGEYEYLDVIVEGGDRVLIDIDFRSEFKIAQPTGNYKLKPNESLKKSTKRQK
ncbi:uncharacterized protein LOC112524098 isoform X2 [Cynara cardunculus var. scolymus]|uniref:uncharacterized protein LOC112524098 isoform X2 n=1 Tax=Cynara cardunculus var. scolymus TaxID=59895 RepID=UPI000D626B74|nr:uncharacterized protein LOC112524098 isoform X2 [Cynara cardunculus var. scolymus]